ncbi:MAG: dTDP-4-dehydrorhamnose 3,5-epimerase [Bacteroidales bacterium]|nr:dTDP-4-dehydrorhamnose 3,5-epimerase [Bacteroidales bacterium]
MRIENTNIDGVLLVEPLVFSDSRGCFYEAFSERDFAAALAEAMQSGAEKPCAATRDGIKGAGCPRFVQDNVSESARNVIRGLHFQRPPHAQAKLVAVLQGRVLDVAVDLRKGSPTFGQHVAVELSDENHRRLYIPRGFAHGFVALSEKVVLQYKCDNYYAPEAEGGILWNDPDLNIDWGVAPEAAILSEKDCNHPPFTDFDSPFKYDGKI